MAIDKENNGDSPVERPEGGDGGNAKPASRPGGDRREIDKGAESCRSEYILVCVVYLRELILRQIINALMWFSSFLKQV
jgi:hypothetical protein